MKKINSIISEQQGFISANFLSALAFLSVALIITIVLSSKYFLWSVRGVLAAVAVTFIILGVFNQGMRDVLTKAINICMECIGLG